MSNLKKSWPFILDNDDDPDFYCQGYFPSWDRETVILTSRVVDCSRYETIGPENPTGLDRKECVGVLLKAAEIPTANEFLPNPLLRFFVGEIVGLLDLDSAM